MTLHLAPGLALKAGQTIAGRYRVEELLGTGASGYVVSARHVWLRQRVTLKLLVAHGEAQLAARERRVARARAALRLRSPHVARVVEIGSTDDGIPFIACERLEGVTLDVELDARERLPFHEAARWILQACEGLAEAHALGLAHGDLSPKSLLLATPGRRAKAKRDREAPDASHDRRSTEREPDRRVLKILDFDAAGAFETAAGAEAHAWLAPPAYLAPEQVACAASADPRADVWSLGMILHEAIDGSLPFAGETVSATLIAIARDAAPLVTDAPYELARLVHRCLDKDPEARPADVGELAAGLAPFAGPDGEARATAVRAALAAPPPAEAVEGSADDAAAESEDARPTDGATPRAWSETTAPSMRTRARRRTAKRARTAALALAVAAVAVGTACFVVRGRADTRPAPSAAADERDDAVAGEHEVALEPPPPPKSEATPEMATPAEDLPSAPASAAPAPRPKARRAPTTRSTSQGRHRSTAQPASGATAGTARPVPLPAGLPSTRLPVNVKPTAKQRNQPRGARDVFSDRK